MSMRPYSVHRPTISGVAPRAQATGSMTAAPTMASTTDMTMPP